MPDCRSNFGHLFAITRRTDTNWLLSPATVSGSSRPQHYSGPVTYWLVRCERCGWKPEKDEEHNWLLEYAPGLA